MTICRLCLVVAIMCQWRHVSSAASSEVAVQAEEAAVGRELADPEPSVVSTEVVIEVVCSVSNQTNCTAAAAILEPVFGAVYAEKLGVTTDLLGVGAQCVEDSSSVGDDRHAIIVSIMVSIPEDVSQNLPAYNLSAVEDDIGTGPGQSNPQDYFSDTVQIITLNVAKNAGILTPGVLDSEVTEDLQNIGEELEVVIESVSTPAVVVKTTVTSTSSKSSVSTSSSSSTSLSSSTRSSSSSHSTSTSSSHSSHSSSTSSSSSASTHSTSTSSSTSSTSTSTATTTSTNTPPPGSEILFSVFLNVTNYTECSAAEANLAPVFVAAYAELLGVPEGYLFVTVTCLQEFTVGRRLATQISTVEVSVTVIVPVTTDTSIPAYDPAAVADQLNGTNPYLNDAVQIVTLNVEAALAGLTVDAVSNKVQAELDQRNLNEEITIQDLGATTVVVITSTTSTSTSQSSALTSSTITSGTTSSSVSSTSTLTSSSTSLSSVSTSTSTTRTTSTSTTSLTTTSTTTSTTTTTQPSGAEVLIQASATVFNCTQPRADVLAAAFRVVASEQLGVPLEYIMSNANCLDIGVNGSGDMNMTDQDDGGSSRLLQSAAAGNVLLGLVVDIPTDVSTNIDAYNESAVAETIGEGEGQSRTEDYINPIIQIVTLNVAARAGSFTPGMLDTWLQAELANSGEDVEVRIEDVGEATIIIKTTSTTSSSTSTSLSSATTSSSASSTTMSTTSTSTATSNSASTTSTSTATSNTASTTSTSTATSNAAFSTSTSSTSTATSAFAGASSTAADADPANGTMSTSTSTSTLTVEASESVLTFVVFLTIQGSGNTSAADAALALSRDMDFDNKLREEYASDVGIPPSTVNVTVSVVSSGSSSLLRRLQTGANVRIDFAVTLPSAAAAERAAAETRSLSINGFQNIIDDAIAASANDYGTTTVSNVEAIRINNQSVTTQSSSTSTTSSALTHSSSTSTTSSALTHSSSTSTSSSESSLSSLSTETSTSSSYSSRSTPTSTSSTARTTTSTSTSTSTVQQADGGGGGGGGGGDDDSGADAGIIVLIVVLVLVLVLAVVAGIWYIVRRRKRSHSGEGVGRDQGVVVLSSQDQQQRYFDHEV